MMMRRCKELSYNHTWVDHGSCRQSNCLLSWIEQMVARHRPNRIASCSHHQPDTSLIWSSVPVLQVLAGDSRAMSLSIAALPWYIQKHSGNSRSVIGCGSREACRNDKLAKHVCYFSLVHG